MIRRLLILSIALAALLIPRPLTADTEAWSVWIWLVGIVLTRTSMLRSKASRLVPFIRSISASRDMTLPALVAMTSARPELGPLDGLAAVIWLVAVSRVCSSTTVSERRMRPQMASSVTSSDAQNAKRSGSRAR